MKLHYSIGIVAHQDRRRQAEELAGHVHAQVLSMDDGTLGCTRNHLAVWRTLQADPGADWGVVMEDDALPVPGFNRQLALILAAAPTPVVSLYLGTGNPLQWQRFIQHALASLEKSSPDTCFITGQHLLHGVCYAIRADLIGDMLAEVSEDSKAIDQAVTNWCRQNHHLVSYGVPSCVDHRDGPSVIGDHPDGSPRRLPRRAWRFGTRDRWRSRSVLLSQ